jgi:chromosome segregation ATPase
MKNTAGGVFVRFLGLGVLALLIAMVGLKTQTSNSNFSTLTLAATIFAVNMFVVIGYTLVIIGKAALLAEEDAPDLAYYLGFSLTVTSLALSFISDVGLASDAAAKSNLIKGSLAQFGAGLLATLIGLCAKILINSKQALLASNPEVLYREFRQEIRSFEQALNSMTSSMRVSIDSACEAINSSVASAAGSMEKLSERLKISSDLIAENLTIEKISKPIQDFSDELLKLQAPTHDLIAEISDLANSASAITKGFSALDATILNVRQAAIEETKNIVELIETKKRLNETSRASIDLLEDQNEVVAEASKQLTRLKNGSSKTADSYELVSAASEKLLSRSGELEQGLAQVSQSAMGSAKELSELTTINRDFNASIRTSSESIEVLTTRSASVNAVLLDTLSSLSSLGEKLRSVPESLDKTLNSFDTLTSSMANTANSTGSFVRSLDTINSPLGEASESVKNLHLAVTKLNQDIESLSRIVATKLS